MKSTFPGSILIFGAGAVGVEFLNILERARVPVFGFLDNNKPLDALVAGKPVYRPNDCPHGRETPVLIGVRHKNVSCDDIILDLRLAGWRQIIPTLGCFVRHYHNIVGDIFWMTEPGYYERPEIISRTERAKTIWADVKSREVYEGLLTFRKTYKDEMLTPPDMDDEYFPADIPAWGKEVRFIDGGAFTGDTLNDLLKRGYDVEKAAEFEPDPNSFSKLIRFLQSELKPDFPVYCWPCALAAQEATHCFKSEAHRPMGSSLCAQPGGEGVPSEIHVPCVRLDAVLYNFRPTLIKLDIEGAERQALEGARETLKMHRPGWAVCAYHRADDLWEIPLWFVENARGLGYRYYLRAHNPGGTNDHCFYAISV